MWFLVKAVIGFTLVLLVLPFFSSAPQPAADMARPVAVGATIEAAKAAIDDMTGICQRRPDVCKTGGEALAALGGQAREGALIAYRYLDQRFGPKGDDAVLTGTVAARAGSQSPAVTEASSAIAQPAPRVLAEQEATRAAVAIATETVLPRPYSPPQH